METENPYQPPRGDVLEAEIVEPKTKGGRPIPKNRWQALNEGCRRGSTVGMYIGMAITFGLVILLRVLPWCITGKAIVFTPDMPWLYVILLSVLSWLVVSMLFFGVPGGLIMGLIEMIRFRKPNHSEE